MAHLIKWWLPLLKVADFFMWSFGAESCGAA
jgi:hypothetical protein